MRSGKIRDKVLLALSIAGLFAGAALLSGGHCGGGGGGMGYESPIGAAAK